MRTFYLFKVNDEYSKLTKDIPYNLYNTYASIKVSNPDNLNYVYNQYKSITSKVKMNDVNRYLMKKMNNLDGYSIYRNTHLFNDYYSGEASKLIVYNSYFVLKSNKSNSTFFSVLEKIPNLFVIDFDNKDYFWLTSNNLTLVN
ncbi:MAG: sporulation inhibitor of replication protein SirA [Bacilli bacterium]|nr:sporulation inhibitor of replication protein SirA [Bacilli bacterium]